MNVECKDRDRIFENGHSPELEALAIHARSCAECRRELEIWNELSLAARAMHQEWESPTLWPRIRESLILESQQDAARPARGRFAWFLTPHWQTVAAAIILVALTATGTWLLTHHSRTLPNAQSPFVATAPDAQRRLLTEQALHDAENAEQAYVKSIDKLSALAEPKLEHAASPLLVSYREKLMVLDAAIAECKAAEERNPLNADLQHELQSVYQEKERTLEAVLREN